jgi:signal transduction histidine kinase
MALRRTGSLVERLRLTAVSAGYAVLAVLALVRGVLSRRAEPGPGEGRTVGSDPAAAAAPLREDSESADPAPEDLPSAVRSPRPPPLADRGLAGGIEALTVSIPLPVTVAVDLPRGIPGPVESAAYAAVAQCLADLVERADATHAWVVGWYDDGVLHLEVGDDGQDGADPASDGHAGVARGLAACGGTVAVASPRGGPTIVTLEVPCRAG